MKVLLLILSSIVFAQTNQQVDPMMKQLEEHLKRTQNMFEQFFQDDFIDQMNGRFMRPDGLIENDWSRVLGGLKTSWKETDRAKILVVEGEISGEDPLDIQVKDGMISLKGIVKKKVDRNGQKSTHQYQFQRSYSIPPGTDVSQMDIQKKGEKEIWLVFPFATIKPEKKKRNDGLKPLKSKKSDRTI